MIDGFLVCRYSKPLAISSIIDSYVLRKRRAKIKDQYRKTHDFVQRRRIGLPNIIKKIAIRAEFADDHNRGLLGIFRDADSKLIMAKAS